MNISSVIIIIKDQNLVQEAKSHLENFENLEIGLIKDNNIIAILSTSSLEEEIKLFRQIQDLEYVIDVRMHYSYMEDELEKSKSEIDSKNTFKTLNCDASSIIYNGDLKNKF